MSEASAIQLEKEALEKYREWHEFMSNALIPPKILDRDSFIAGYVAGKAAGMSASLDKINSRLGFRPCR